MNDNASRLDERAQRLAIEQVSSGKDNTFVNPWFTRKHSHSVLILLPQAIDQMAANEPRAASNADQMSHRCGYAEKPRAVRSA